MAADDHMVSPPCVRQAQAGDCSARDIVHVGSLQPRDPQQNALHLSAEGQSDRRVVLGMPW